MGCSECEKKRRARAEAAASGELVVNERTVGARIGQLARGIKGMASYAIGKTKVQADIAEERQSICEACPSDMYNFGICDETKGGCGCVLFYKVRVTVEECPQGHWQAVEG
tara:strand:- start:8561 stop:8893 length:333 start_codon:yes stop_codon:yes gene_type:complete